MTFKASVAIYGCNGGENSTMIDNSIEVFPEENDTFEFFKLSLTFLRSTNPSKKIGEFILTISKSEPKQIFSTYSIKIEIKFFSNLSVLDFFSDFFRLDIYFFHVFLINRFERVQCLIEEAYTCLFINLSHVSDRFRLFRTEGTTTSEVNCYFALVII